jgi:MoxR-like ATPase
MEPARVSAPEPRSIFREASEPYRVSPPDVQLVQAAVSEASVWVAPLRTEVARVLVGQRALVDRLLVSLLTGGHVLIEGVPGLAKTLALKTFARTIDARFQRIQFTPDMVPADVIGTIVYNPNGRFEPKHGPIFANLVLADEINRAPTRVQSALLEAMQEGQVTLGDETHPLPSPFFVMATQNPIEHGGTYPLAEAQIDRFMLKLVVTYPTPDEELAILDAMATTSPALGVVRTVTASELIEARRVIDWIYLDDDVRRYIVSLVVATREPASFGLELAPLIKLGASPRATIALTLCAKAWAFLNGRGYVTPKDVKMIAADVLRHRVAVSYEAEADAIDADQIVACILDQVAIP